jgi:hypothetical protein
MVIALFRRTVALASRPIGSAREQMLMAGLSGIFVANGASFIVSQQVFGDPFIICTYILFIGILLSSARIVPRMPGEELARVVPDRTRLAWPSVRGRAARVAGPPHG